MKKLSMLTLALGLTALQAHGAKLIVVDDKGGDSALHYYSALNPQSDPAPSASAPPADWSSALGFPIKSARLSPGIIQARVINAPGLQPFFIIGDDQISQAWLQQREAVLRQLRAVGMVVNVGSRERLAAVQSWIKGVEIAPASGDDLAQRLGLNHYPALITATAIEQ